MTIVVTGSSSALDVDDDHVIGWLRPDAAGSLPLLSCAASAPDRPREGSISRRIDSAGARGQVASSSWLARRETQVVLRRRMVDPARERCRSRQRLRREHERQL
jgi:hypothetical protein